VRRNIVRITHVENIEIRWSVATNAAEALRMLDEADTAPSGGFGQDTQGVTKRTSILFEKDRRPFGSSYLKRIAARRCICAGSTGAARVVPTAPPREYGVHT
jgi:hypothetical protein